jgi:hypothetical protein
MSRTIIDIDDEKLLAAAVDAGKRARVLDSFRDLLGRLDMDLIEQDEIDDHTGHAA